MTKAHVVNVDEIDQIEALDREHWGQAYKVLTPSMDTGKLGANLTRVPSGRVAVPFHAHQLEDEVFYILEGRGVLRYGDTLQDVRPGDCISCPAGTGTAHQLANPFDEDLVYLAFGHNDPNEVAFYPDSGKVGVFGPGLRKILRADAELDYFEGEE
jgi:uncharacterized cupin superfamily protein